MTAATAPESPPCVLFITHHNAHTATWLDEAPRYDTHVATLADAATTCARLAPDVVIIELQAASVSSAAQHAEEVEDAGITLARRLRRDAATHTVPIVLLYRQDAHHLRAAAASIGVDDYFAFDTLAIEAEARIESLFWRAEVARRASQSSGNQQSEIDAFIQLLDAVRVDARHGLTGTLVLVEEAVNASSASPVDSGRRGAGKGKRPVQVVYNFLKLNLRRLDTIAFYGPSTLLVYLPRTGTGAARARLTALHDELIDTRLAHHQRFGMASFPADGNDPETLIPAAEIDLESARHANSLFARRMTPSRAQATHNKAAIPKPFASDDQHAEAATMNHQKSDTRSLSSLSPAFSSASSFSNSSLSLPAPPSAPASRAEIARPPETPTPSSRVRILPRRVLLAVSDATRLSNLNALLRNGGYEVRAAFDGQQALDLLRIDNPDLVVIDYDLRDMSGVEVLERLRVRKQSPAPVVMISAEDDTEAHRAAAQLGARNITFPYMPSELLDTLRSLIPA